MAFRENFNVSKELEKLNNSRMLAYNKRKALEYYNEKIAQGIKKISLIMPLRVIHGVGIAFPAKKFEELSKHELMQYFNELKPAGKIFKQSKLCEGQTDTLSERSLLQYKYKLRAFYKWLFNTSDDDPLPEPVKWIRKLKTKNGDKLKKEVFTTEEIHKMIQTAKNARDKAAIAILWEYGLRASELLGMKKSDLRFHENFVEFEADGKTGKRDVFLVESKPFLEAWLKELEEKKHQLPKELHDHIWVAFQQIGYKDKPLGKNPLSLVTLNLKIKEIAKKAGIKKRIWTHGFRHSAATRDAVKGWNESQLKAKYGWTGTSTMASVYVHFASENLKKKILQEKGIWKPDKEQEPLEPFTINCPFCSHTNMRESQYCKDCGKPMHLEQIKSMEKKSMYMEVMQEMMQAELEKQGVDMGKIAKAFIAKTR